MRRAPSLSDFEAQFPNEEACWRGLVQARWPQGFQCPRCDGKDASLVRTRRVFKCKGCAYQCSVTAGTLLQDTKLPLRTWLLGLFLVATTKKSISACELQRKLGLGSYKSAWLLLQKVQHVLSLPGDSLRGVVEVDETFVGGKTRGTGGRGTNKSIVVVAVEDQGNHAGRMAAETVPDASARSLQDFVRGRVERGAVVKTDGFQSYRGLNHAGYEHRPEQSWVGRRKFTLVLPRMHTIAANLKRVINGTHGGRVRRKHLAKYVGAFGFRYDHRGWMATGYSEAIQRAVHARPLTFRMVVR